MCLNGDLLKILNFHQTYKLFSKGDFEALRNSLRQCIPLIKFRNLTSKEFTGKELPNKKILPKELYQDLLKIFLSKLVKKSKENRFKKSRLYFTNLKMD